MQTNLKQWFIFYCISLILILFLFFDYLKISSQFLAINYLDVGQGDATLIITPQNQKILIDSGPTGNLAQNLKQYFSFFDKKIDLFILTHTDNDHIGGLLDILKTYSIQQIALPQDTKNKSEFIYLIKFIQKNNIPIIFPNQNTDLQLTSHLFIDFLYPTSEILNSNQNKLSNSSLVFKIIYNNTAFLFSGDAPQKQEKQIILTGENLQANIYQVGHHGSKTSSSQTFLQSIQPDISIISVAKNNSFGHPHLETLEKLQHINSQIYQTSQEGNLSFFSNGNKVWRN